MTRTSRAKAKKAAAVAVVAPVEVAPAVAVPMVEAEPEAAPDAPIDEAGEANDIVISARRLLKLSLDSAAALLAKGEVTGSTLQAASSLLRLLDTGRSVAAKAGAPNAQDSLKRALRDLDDEAAREAAAAGLPFDAGWESQR